MSIMFRLISIATLLAVLPASAANFKQASMALCEKVKSCAMAKMDQKEMTPQMRQMLEPMFETMCESARNYVDEVATGHEMYPVAVACMNSMSNLSCEQMETLDQNATPECAKYEAMAKKYGNK